MKNTRKILPALAMLILSAVMMSTASFAWFSTNNTVAATGMQVNATAAGALAISQNVNVDGTSASTNFESGVQALSAMTWIDPDDTGEKAAGWYYVTNPGNVDGNTGLAATGKTLDYAAAPTTGYYKDYVVYIAATGQAMSGKTLKATVDFGTTANGQQAVTVAFLVKTQTGTAVSTIALSDVTNSKEVAAADSTKEIELATGLAIPLNTSNESIPVIMRVYVDGAAAAGGQAYVNSNDGNVANTTVKVTFTAN